MNKQISQEARERSHQIRNKTLMLNIAGLVEDQEAANRIIQMLMDADMEHIQADTCPNFEVWLDDLPEEPMKGLADCCLDYIRHWGNGGGDYSTEECIRAAITELGSDSPQELADAIFHSVVDYSKSPFEASCLTIDLVEDSISECECALRKEN